MKLSQISVSDGLSNSDIFSIVQDSSGFIWVATYEGLNRFDGAEFVEYRHNDDLPNSIANNLVRALLVDSNDQLWVGTHNGLSRYNVELDNFDNFTHQPSQEYSLLDNIILDIFEDNNGTLFISTDKGVQIYDPDNNNFKKVKIRGYEGQITEIKTLAQDDNNNYWFGSFGNGIYLANKSFSNAENIRHNDITTSIWPININANTLYDFKIIGENYWLATDNGLYIVNSDYELIRHLNTRNTNQLLLSNEIRAIQEFDEEIVWLGTREGLNQVKITDFSVKKIASNDDTTANLPDYWITSIYKSYAGQILISSYGGGIYIYTPSKSIFNNELKSTELKNKRIVSIAESTAENVIWFANEDGELYSIREHGVKKTNFNDPIRISQIHTHRNKLVLDTLNEELFVYSLKSRELERHPLWKSESQFPYFNSNYLIDQNLCYISSIKNLRCYNYIEKSFKSNSFENDPVTSINHASDNKVIAITQSNRIYLYSPESDVTENIYQLAETNFETKLIINSDNWIWLISEQEGILLINLDSNSVQHITESNGLKNVSVESVIIDNENNLWFSTNRGISSINPRLATVRNFDSDYGIDNEQFVTKSVLKTRAGDIYFGSIQGAVKFFPEIALNSSVEIASPKLTGVYAANQAPTTDITKVNEQNTFFITSNISQLEKLQFRHDLFPLSFDFIVPNVNLPSQVKYRYRLLGLDSKWLVTDHNNRRATYSALSPGDYIFELEAYNMHRPDNTTRTQIEIEVLPPWWLSHSALLIYGLIIFLCGLYVLQQFRHKRLYHLQIKASEERLKLSLWGSGDEMWDWNIVTGKIFRSNIWGTLDFPQDGKRNVGTEHTNIHPHDIPRVKEALNDHFEQKSEHYESTYRVKNQNEQWMWVLDRGKIVDRNDKGTATRMTGTLKDISHIKKAEERLKLFAKCIENISDAVIIYDRQFMIVDVNKAYVEITGKSKSRMQGKPLQFERYGDNFTQGVKKHLITHGSWRGEIESRRENNEVYYTDLSIDVIRDESGNISHFVSVFSDVTSRKKNEAELRKLANSDTLTGLPNRSFFQANQLHLVKNKTPHALLVFDLDHFKKINDSMGHQVGDLLLIEVAKRLLSLGNKKNIVYRLGGDEFSIIIENTNDIHTITTVAKQILSVIAQPLRLKNQEVVLYSSIGIVLYPEDGATPQELLKNADTAMYHAKDNGGNKYQFFSDSMNKQAVKRLQIESLIRHGLKDDLFSVFYQPKIEISTGKIAGMEALVRFETPSKGIISPLVFIPVSEETGQIIDIGEIVLRKACHATKKWVDAGLFEGRVAVNLSAVQFTQPNLVSMISHVLQESGLAPKYLELEITEGTVMDSPQRAIDTMLQIRAMGIHLSLDDFGTGYSSLAYLKKFPLNTLKIDKAFVDDIEISEQGRNMVATIVTIAHNLGLHVVAEGVENNNQLNFLSGLACEQLQGYLYSKPLAEPEFQKYLLSYQITDQSTTSFIRN
ncbi:EAL domain-containing protein [Thalassotalea atypica]|uniref:EAL domain-containing protein n=1 Tax=Thalassotalea atypica TaxID=2054316 RepID=UPI0025731CEB|nr:EAL domain-containing protein [Thalassotalea atypica]